MHTNLKGRIFSSEGISYLVLQEHTDSPEWLRVKALDSGREIRLMRAIDVLKYFPDLVTTGS